MASNWQNWKQFDEITDVDRGTQIDFSIELENADCPTLLSFAFRSNATQERAELWKQLGPISITDLGIQIDVSEPQSENADSPKIDIRDTDSKATCRTSDPKKL
jgi:hypothetical protein